MDLMSKLGLISVVKLGEELISLRADQSALLAEARALFENPQTMMDEILQLALNRDSPVWIDLEGKRLTGREVIATPLWREIKRMAIARGIEDGMLREDGGGDPPPLDALLRDEEQDPN